MTTDQTDAEQVSDGQEGGETVRFSPPARAISLPMEVLRERLTEYLRAHFGDDSLAIVDLKSPGTAGVNNETLLLTLQSSARELQDIDGLVVRLEAPTTLFPGVTIQSSYECYRALQDVHNVPTPKVYALELDSSLLGRPFYVMQRIDGLIPPDNPTYHQAGWVKEMPTAERSELFENSIRAMARLNQAPVEKFRFLIEMGIGTPRQQMDYWRRYLDESISAEGREPDALLERTWDWLVANFPEDAPLGFSWGDARIPNIIYKGTQCVGILDWDMVSLAGGECDVAWWLINDLAGSAHVSRLDGLHDAASTVRVWEDEYGRKAQNMEFWLMFNLFRLGGIMIRIKRFLAALGTPAEAIKDMDRVNTPQSILRSRWGDAPQPGLGSWADLTPAIRP